MRLIALVTTIAFTLLFIYCAVQRLIFPHEIRWMEGGILDQVLHIRAGGALYVEPSWKFAPYIYTPLYYYVSGAASDLTGPNFISIRLISIISSLFAAVLIGLIVRKETDSSYSAWIAALFYLSAWKATGFFMDAGRFDTFFLALVLACLYCAKYMNTASGQLLAIVLGVHALLVKQTAVIACVPVVIYLFFNQTGKLRFLLPIGGFLAGSATLVFLHFYSDGWFTYYILELPKAHRYQWEKLPTLFSNSLLLTYPFILVIAGMTYWLKNEKNNYRHSFIPVLCATLLVAALLPYMHTGSAANVLMPLQGSAALLLGFCLGTLEKKPLMHTIGVILILPQLAILGYNPQAVIPGEEEKDRAEKLVKCMAAFEGPVLNTRTGFVWRAAQKEMSVHEPAVADIFRTGPSPENKAMRDAFIKKVEDQYYDAIFFGPQMTFELVETLEGHYTPTGFNFTPKAAGTKGKGYMLANTFVANRWLKDRTLPEGIGLCDALLAK